MLDCDFMKLLNIYYLTISDNGSDQSFLGYSADKARYMKAMCFSAILIFLFVLHSNKTLQYSYFLLCYLNWWPCLRGSTVCQCTL